MAHDQLGTTSLQGFDEAVPGRHGHFDHEEQQPEFPDDVARSSRETAERGPAAMEESRQQSGQ